MYNIENFTVTSKVSRYIFNSIIKKESYFYQLRILKPKIIAI